MKKLVLISLLTFTTNTVLPLDGDTVNDTTEKISLVLIGAGALLHLCKPSAFKATIIVKKQEYDLQLSHVLFFVGWMGICLGTVQKMGDDDYQSRGLYDQWRSKKQ